MKLSLSNIRRLVGVALVAGTVLVPFVVLQGSAGEPAEVASDALRYAPGSEEFGTLEDYWTARVTYPTGLFDQRWLLNAAQADKLIKSAVPAGPKTYQATAESALALDPNAFTSLGPRPESNGFGLVGGRVNAIVVDPVDPTIAYFAAIGGGVWKSTNCCTASTTWTVTTDKPDINSIAIDDLFIDQNRWVYAGTGDLNFGSFSMGSYGILRSKDQGATWEVLGADVFIPQYPPALTPTFPQYQAVGKVRVDPNNSNTIIAGTKTGLYFSYDSGANWSGPCLTNAFTTQRQDITGLAVTDNGATTRLVAAVGTRGYPTTVQPDLGLNGANGIYSLTLPATLLPNGCPAVAVWTLLTTGTNGWPVGTGSGVPCNPAVGSTNQCPAGSNEIGRIDIAIAPSDPNIMYAEVQAVDPPGDLDPLSACGSARGCLLGLWQTLNGGTSWTKNANGDKLAGCESNSAQNWYNQAVAVDPADPLHIYMDGIDIWQSFDGGNTLINTTCGYTAGLTHVDQHALTFVPGATPPGSKLLAGNDGGVYLTENTLVPQPLWTQLNSTVSTIEFYSGDISGNFANAATPVAVGGAQDNGSSSAANPGPTSVWTERNGGDGMFARIEQKTGQRVFMESQWGNLVRSTTGHAGSYSGASGGWGPGNASSVDRESFVTPYEIDRHHCPGAGVCSHMILGTYRVWESITATGSQAWIVNSPDLTKCGANPCLTGLRDRAIINALFYGHSDNSIAVVGTNDGNVQYGFKLGTGVTWNASCAGVTCAKWVNVTGGNAVLPNRPILDVTTSAHSPLVSFVGVGGFAENTPTTPGHVYQVTCTAECASFDWVDKTGNLPNIPVDSIAVNPNRPTQVFAGTDWGLYFTNDISVASPAWSRFDAGLPHVMIWDMAVDRGATTLAVFTRGRGAYAWPLPKTPTAVQVRSFTARARPAGVTLTWRSASEVDTLGYNVWRFANGKGVKVNRRLVEAKGQAGGATYRLVDRNARPGAYSYRLQALSRDGSRAWRAKATVRVGRH